MSTTFPLRGGFGRHDRGRAAHSRPDRHQWLAEQEAGEERPRRGRGRRRGGGFGPGGPGPFGPGPFGVGFGPGGFGPHRHRGGRARRGDVRAAILALLAEEAMHGYQLMQEIAQRSDGVWKPSAGSVYPALSLLEDEGLVRPQDEGGRKVFALTDEGRRYVEQHAEELDAPWDAVTGGVSDTMAESFVLLREVGFAAMQVLRSGDPAKVERAKALLTETRRSLYLVLAGEPAPGTDGTDRARPTDRKDPTDPHGGDTDETTGGATA